MILKTLNLVWLICILNTFPSCKEQVEHKEFNQAQNNPLSIGKLVSEIDSKIWAIYQDQKGRYWFGSNGSGVFQLDGKILTQFTIKDGLCSQNILSIQEDRIGNIYFDTPEGVCKFDGETIYNLGSNRKEFSI